MGLHVAAMITGAAMGALVTYITKDEEARKTVERFIDGTGDAFQAFLRRITPEKTAGVEDAAEADATVVEIEPAGEPSDPPGTEKAGAAEKSMH